MESWGSQKVSFGEDASGTMPNHTWKLLQGRFPWWHHLAMNALSMLNAACSITKE